MKGALVMTKSASVYARIDPVLKKEIPFEVRLPYEKPVCMGALSEEELNAELENGYADILAGRTKPAKQAFAEMRKDFNL